MTVAPRFSLRKPCRSWHRARRGLTLIEVMVTSAVIVVLAAAVLPLARVTIKRQKEIELREDLRQMRRAIDDYKKLADQGLIQLDVEQEGYPRDLDELVKGVDIVGQVDKKAKFLRRVPIDPMTGKAEWGLRSYQDEWDATSWGGEDVYDVYSLAGGVGMNGTPYRKW